MEYCFIIDNQLVLNARKEKNYIIEYDDSYKDKSSCTIYFSSNGIYFPNDEATFIDSIINRNRFEWRKKRRNCYKHIFIRDMYKQWYLKGINNEIDSIDKLYRFLREETIGYNITTMGCSAGGYAAILLGKMLGATNIIVFNPQINLVEEFNKGKLPLWNRNITLAEDRFFDISWAITDRVMYFYSVGSEVDKYQYCIAQKTQAKIYRIKDDKHGVPFYTNCLLSVINTDSRNIYISTRYLYTEEDFFILLSRSKYLRVLTYVFPIHKVLLFMRRKLNVLLTYISRNR